MKFGIDPPWYDNPVERLAFNLYAMDCCEKEEEDENEDDEEEEEDE